MTHFAQLFQKLHAKPSGWLDLYGDLAAITLQEQCDQRKQSCESLKFARSILTDELKATNAEYARRIAEFDSKIADMQSQLEASQAALLEFQVATQEPPQGGERR